ncbi:serum response factor-binding protein 1 [Elysia marginata]|uniref:Serum response factor-binding protein 1 n=1 Tax=Elysia marginata TaxID=1093978 RepID=A0AAV4I390_9GAST|nr:serum response factor-binding protein 1 [Elysia marginata]
MSAQVVRSDVPKIAVVLTDGNYQNENQTKDQGLKAAKAGITVISVGVHHEIKYQELLNIAAGDSGNVFNVTKFSYLDATVTEIGEKICEAVEKQKATKPVTETPNTTEPVTDTTKLKEPVTETPKTTKPVTETPNTTVPVTKTPNTTEPVTETPNTTEPLTQTPKTPKPVTETPKTPKPVNETPKTPKPVTETSTNVNLSK